MPAADAGLAVLALSLSLAMLAGGGFGDPSSGARALDGLGVVLAAVSAVPLAWRRAAPFTVYLVMAAASLALDGLDYPFDIPFGPVVGAYGLAVAYSGDPRSPRSTGRRRAAMLALAVFVPATALAYNLSGHRLEGITPELFLWALVFAGLWIAGDRTRLRRERMSELEGRAARAEHEAERERRLAVAEERTRIARELHDSAGHAINVILVQAGAARLLRERDPGGSLRAIATIEEVARDTIGEIDRLVRAMRADTGFEPPEPADPAALEDLFRHHQAGGLSIASDLRGERRSLPHTVAWAAYRILQEALTNAARHGRGRVEVTVWFGPDAVEITVTNPIAPAAGHGGGQSDRHAGGHGIVGMRERAAILGGTLDLAARDGMFRLHARLPRAGNFAGGLARETVR
jgi:signal transduction histidine kinase